MKRKFLLCSLAVTLAFGLIPSVSASSMEIDAVGDVYLVIDGDTFDAFPVGRVRLADIDAPEPYEPGYAEARSFLISKLDAIAPAQVFLDVDDIGVMDVYQRLVCVVYVRHNLTHLLNVNQALLEEGHANVSDYPNEFSPEVWSLYVNHPATALPATYNELLQVYLNLQSSYDSLQAQYNNMSSSYSLLQHTYSDYQVSHSYSNSEYEALDSSYGQYMEDHSYSNTEYAALREQYDRDVGMARNLNYIITTIAVGLVILAIYLAVRKQT